MRIRNWINAGFVALLALSLTAGAKAQQYWLGTRDGYQLKFDVQVPKDVAEVIKNSAPAPNRGADTKPRYKKINLTINGFNLTFHSNEIGWENGGLDSGNLTYAVDAGIGADWKSVDVNDPLYPGFVEAVQKLSKEFMQGWFSAKVIIIQGGQPSPGFRLNPDGTYGKPSPGALARWTLEEMSRQDSLSDEDMTKARNAFLAIANEGRANSNYRVEANCKKARTLPTGLKPLALDDILNQAAQNQAEYCASVKQATHDQPDPAMATMGKRLEAFGGGGIAYEAAGGGGLQDCPTVWMKSETHYRPWWNLDNQAVTKVGFGVAKADDGSWYFVAVLQ